MLSSRLELMQRARALGTDQRGFARLFGVSESRVSKLMNGARLSVSNCLRLADLLGDDPAVALRAYGYPDEAAALERAYDLQGKLPKGQMAVARRYGQLAPRDQRWLREALALLERPPVDAKS